MKKGPPRRGQEVACETCAKAFYCHPSQLSKRYCGMRCRDIAVRSRRVNEADGTARCGRCREWKPIADFVRSSGGRPHSYCKPCSSLWFHERRGTPPERRKTYIPAYKLTPEEKRAAILEQSRRNHLRRRAAGKPPPRAELEAIWCLQHGRCAYCQRYVGSTYHIDHKLPITRGGTNDLSNLQLTCPRCNMRKGTLTHDEFLASKRRPVVSWDEHERS